MGLFAGILLLCALVIIHELGHFLVAKWFGVKVETFSVGFGPKLIKRRWRDTEYCLSLIPLGGYVKMLGETQDEELSPEDQARSFLGQVLWKKSLIAFAGPFFNLVLPIILFFAIGIGTQQIPRPIIGIISPEHAAERSGLLPGDEVKSINQQPIQSFLEMVQIVSAHPEQSLLFEVERAGGRIQLEVVPEREPNPNRLKKNESIGRIGAQLAEPIAYRSVFVGPWKAAQNAVQSTYVLVEMTVQSLWMLMKLEVPAKELGGPLMIMNAASQAADQGWKYYLQLMALISVNLGLLNLLPIPVLDGGYLVLFGLEAILRKPISPTLRQRAMQLGLALLLSLMALALFNDISRIFYG
ncbi:MAG: RIP metalloprotease RseP [Myxococcaceae bacterium]|nr:RIP metalloprotease RseP [Myxococcaceae bacterium]MBH2005941.1 RIP metalloprotease RseP [Myxococcaceae bacterium]